MSVYSEKFNYEIDLNNPESTHTKVVNLIGEGKTVLDVGCASGYMAKVLKNKFNCKVYGLELDKDDAKMAEEFCEEVIVGDIETIDLSEHFSEGQFDVVIFADLLEHLNNPEIVLEKIQPYLKGFLAISIPNIAHSSIVYELMSGRFEYTPMGLLDETHKRFFTKDSFSRLLSKTGYEVFSVESVKVSPSASEKQINLSNYPENIVKYISEQADSDDYQYVFKAFRTNPELDILKKEYQRSLEERVKREEDLNVQLESTLQEVKHLESRLDWYKGKLKEQLQLNSEQSFRLIKAERELAVMSKYSADNYPGLIAYPVKLLMLIYRCGFKDLFTYHYGKVKEKKES